MSIFRIPLCLFILGSLSSSSLAQTPSVIPQPVALESHQGLFRITSATPVIADEEAEAKANQLIDTLAPAMGFRLELVEPTEANQAGILLMLDEALETELGTEGYLLEVTSDRVSIRAAMPAGLFYGIQTLRQLLPPQIFSANQVEGVDWEIACVTITDYPRFEWRGMLIDPARHFIPVEDFKHFVDAMALHKYNRLQVHFTDNIAWRIEIMAYPDLTRLASHRDRSGGEGGFYSQDDIRELVRYAAKRNVTIVPEIEMPYHAGAAINAYPEIGINPVQVTDLSPEERWGRLGGLVAPRPETVTFMQNVLSEVIDLFPCQHIHIGGDEANIEAWTEDPEMQRLMTDLECADAGELHSWFIKQMDAYLTENGRRMIGWGEILQGGLASGATVMSWRGMRSGVTAAQSGNDVIMAPMSHTYFDYRQATGEQGFGRGVLNLQRAYNFEPIPDVLNAEQATHVLGGQGQLWGELIPDAQRRDYMAWPRACALSETLWSPQGNRDYPLFLSRLTLHLERLDAASIGYRTLDP